MHPNSSSSSLALPPLDYSRPNPVRGQLEPHDERTRKSGCRFLQCTDTPGELKVLLPPRTAQVYALLLKAELIELEKQHDASWERILDIRRLKDRMIRKCQRLAKAYSASNPGSGPFLTVHAPPDFRVKEIEKWIRHHEGSDTLKRIVPLDALRQRGSFCCDRCANLVPHQHSISARRSSTQSAHSRHSSISAKSLSKSSTLTRRSAISSSDTKDMSHRPSSPGRSSLVSGDTVPRVTEQEILAEEHTTLHVSDHLQENVTSHVVDVRQESSQVRAAQHRQSTSIDKGKFPSESKFQDNMRSIDTIVEDPHEFSMDRSNHSYTDNHSSEVESLARLSIISPDPLPIPYHGSTSATFLEICDSPVDVIHPETNKHRQKTPSAEDSTPSPPSEDERATDGMPRPDLLRRRSSLKRSNSELRMSMAYSTKTVSWAMDRDWAQQITKYHAAAAEVEHADVEWDVVCEKYQEELAGLKVLRRNVTQTLSKLRTETEKLQREDEVIRDQEEKLRQGYEQLELKHGQYRAKVKAALQETEQVLTLCGTKRDGEFQGR